MPYVVTTRKRAWLNYESYPTCCCAVATLDEARAFALDRVADAMDEDTEHLLAAAESLPRHGGTIGPLPDKTVIEVERTWGRDLLRAIDASDAAFAHYNAFLSDQEAIAFACSAYNEAQAEEGR